MTYYLEYVFAYDRLLTAQKEKKKQAHKLS